MLYPIVEKEHVVLHTSCMIFICVCKYEILLMTIFFKTRHISNISVEEFNRWRKEPF